MIAVIADDFTGAAEVGGIVLKYGLKVVIETAVKEIRDVDILIIDADTRSLTAGQAKRKIETITKKLLEQKPEYIFKKLDSVLRGNIAEELVAQMDVSNKKRTIIIAANPSMGRIIENGQYYVNSVPLSETFFSNDPEFPIKTSSVLEIIQNVKCQVVSKNIDEELPESGLIVGNVTNQDDLRKWAELIDESTIAAGGSGFFDVILGMKYLKIIPSNGTVRLGEKTLFVFGSTFPNGIDILKRLKNEGIIKMNMPEGIYNQKNFNPELIENWSNEIVSYINRNQKVIISVEYHHSNEPGLSTRIKETMAQLVQIVYKKAELTDLFIEGGATTSEILKSLNISKLYPVKELDFGIIQMHAEGYPSLCITTKPGSYSWPKSVVFENVSIMNS